MRKIGLCAVLFVFLGMSAFADETLKVATVAPEGSPWLKVMRKMAEELEKETGGRLKIKFYAGGVLGDDKVVLDKMRFGQIHAAGLTGVGLGEIVPEVRLMELPFQFDSYSQVDCVLNALYDDLAKKFEEKGFVLLGWADQGFVYVFSKKEIKGVKDMQGAKPWVWEADVLAKAIFKVMGINPTPLALQDVFTSLQTGLVDTVYISPVAAISLQWFTKVQYMVDMPITDGSGAIVMSKQAYDKLDPDLQKALSSKVKEYAKKLTRITREMNQKSLKTLEEKGIVFIKPTDQDVASFRAKGLEAARSLVGQLYSQQALDRALGILKGCK